MSSEQQHNSKDDDDLPKPVILARSGEGNEGNIRGIAVTNRVIVSSAQEENGVVIRDPVTAASVCKLPHKPTGYFIGTCAIDLDRKTTLVGSSVERGGSQFAILVYKNSGDDMIKWQERWTSEKDDCHTSAVNGLDFNPRNARSEKDFQIVSAAQDGLGKVWNFSDKDDKLHLFLELKWSDGKCTDCKYNPSATKIAISYVQNRVIVFDSTNGTQLQELRHADDVNAVSFFADNRLVSTGDDKHVKLFDVESGKELADTRVSNITMGISATSEVTVVGGLSKRFDVLNTTNLKKQFNSYHNNDTEKCGWTCRPCFFPGSSDTLVLGTDNPEVIILSLSMKELYWLPRKVVFLLREGLSGDRSLVECVSVYNIFYFIAKFVPRISHQELEEFRGRKSSAASSTSTSTAASASASASASDSASIKHSTKNKKEEGNCLIS